MTATVAYGPGNARRTVTLGPDLVWRGTEAAVVETLNLVCGRDQLSPADGHPVAALGRRGAELLGGTTAVEGEDETVPGRVY